MSTLNQQTLADSGANERPPMLKKGNYIPWESRFRRFLDNKLEYGERMNEFQRLMFGSSFSHVRHSRLMDEFDKFAAKEGESLESVYERLTTLVNIIDRNNVRPIPVSINTKSSNCLIHVLEQICYHGRQNRNQAFNVGTGNGESNQIVQCVPQTESTPRKANVQCYNCNEKGHYACDSDGNAETVPSYDAKAVSEVNASSKVHEQLEKKAFKEREDRYLDDILDLEEKLSSHDRIVYKMGQSIQTIHMLGKKPNKVYDPFLKAGLGYTNPVRLKKAIAAQPKMYDGDLIHNNKLVIHTTDSEETLEDAEESRNKMRHKMVQIDYEKLNALYETFVPQQELSAEQTYFSIPSTSDNGSTSKDVPSESPGPKMPTESRLLTMIDTLGDTIIGFQTRINKTFLQDTERRWLSDSQNELREFYKTDVIPMSRSLYKTLSEIKEELIEEVQEITTKHELLKVELEKSASDSRDIQANLLKRIKILENDFQRSQAQSIDFELKLQHQKEKMDCDVSWKAKLSTLHDENVLLKHQVESTVKERENIKLEFQKLFNSIKATQAQHQNEINEMFEYNKLKTINKGKHVNTKFEKSETLGQLLCVTLFNTNLAIKAKNVSNTKVTSDRSKPVTSQSTPTIEQKQQHNANVIARGMYKINQEDTKTPPYSKANTNVSNSTCVDDLYKLLLVQIMDAPTLPVFADKNLGDPIEIRVHIVHPAPVDVFPAATVVRTLAQHGEAIRGIHGHLQGVPINEEMSALRFRMGMVKEENASLRGKIKTMEATDTVTRRQEKRARMELEQKLASVQES
ncbi:hypothetical protein Tco_0327612 [Tanacetum coccineum]